MIRSLSSALAFGASRSLAPAREARPVLDPGAWPHPLGGAPISLLSDTPPVVLDELVGRRRVLNRLGVEMSDKDEPNGAAIEQDVGDALADIFANHEHGFVLKWTALVETVAPDGTRGLWTTASEDLKPWDAVGMLCHALQLQQARTVHGEFSDD